MPSSNHATTQSALQTRSELPNQVCWLGRFAVHSMLLRHSLPLWSAALRAKRAYPYASGMSPEQAAEQDMTIPLWPGQRAIPR